MILEFFTALVGLLAVIYAGIAKFIQNKLIDRSEIETIQAESKELNEKLKKAKERNDQKEMEKIMKKQMEFLPKMNKVMIGQFKPMIYILAVFFVFTWAIGHIDPHLQDDITVTLKDNGMDCDLYENDGIYSACVEPHNEGKWVAHVKSFKNGGETGSNATYFNYGQETDDTYVDGPKGKPLVVSTDKMFYSEGETVSLYAQADDVSTIEATLDNATAFRVDLPITIPILNVTRIYQPYWWFILISLISNLSFGFVIGRLKKKDGKKK
jgi:hypothetical protein